VSERLVRLDLRDARWTAFVARHPEASFYNHPEWAQLVAESYGYPSFVLGFTEGELLTAGVPVVEVRNPLGRRRWISVPFTDYCPLLSGGVDLVSGLVDAARSAQVPLFELRTELAEHPTVQPLVVGVRHRLRLGPDPEVIRRGFSGMHRKNIRTAERVGVTMGRGSSRADVNGFYALHLRTRRRQGVPIQPRRFFDRLGDILARGYGFVSTAYWNERPIASAVFLTWNGVSIQKYAASDERYWKYCANNLLNWTEIKWACENGYHTLDWGRIQVDQGGLRQFKVGWGAVEEPVAYSFIGAGPSTRTRSRLQNALAVIIRRSRPEVCRFLGEVLYRYAA
jgi:lipid II:glycine glycyltransferase (peptidoglycan interpeptide bridge formation enzyme)